MPSNHAAGIRRDQAKAGSPLSSLGLNFTTRDHCRTKVLGMGCLLLPDCSGCLCGCCLSISHSSPGREGWAHQYLCYRPGAEGLNDRESLAHQRKKKKISQIPGQVLGRDFTYFSAGMSTPPMFQQRTWCRSTAAAF